MKADFILLLTENTEAFDNNCYKERKYVEGD